MNLTPRASFVLLAATASTTAHAVGEDPEPCPGFYDSLTTGELESFEAEGIPESIYTDEFPGCDLDDGPPPAMPANGGPGRPPDDPADGGGSGADEIRGYADLHTHMFAELAWTTSGAGPFIHGTVEGTKEDAMPRCSGWTDHATIRPGYITGLGIVSEALTAKGESDLAGIAGDYITRGDSGAHVWKRYGDDTGCLYACSGSAPCFWKFEEEACVNADPGICKDNITNPLSIVATVACNTKLNSDSCEGSSYCGATGSSVWSINDDLNPCWAAHPDCDSADICIKRNALKNLSCKDLLIAECSNHPDDCKIVSDGLQGELKCKPKGLGGLTCGDLSPSECANHFDDGGCGMRDCELVECQWEDWEECTWGGALPPNCGEFVDWPSWDAPSHQQHWWGYLKDAHDKGLQIISVSVLDVHPMVQLFPGEANVPFDMIVEQLDAANAFAANHSDWVEIAHTSADARDIIARGKLAMVLALEAAFPFCTDTPCGEGDDETDMGNIRHTLDEYQARGLRAMQLVGHFDNPYGGVAMYELAQHSMQWLFEKLNDDAFVPSIFPWEFPAALNGINTDGDVWADILEVAGFVLSSGLAITLDPIFGFDDIDDKHALYAILGGITGLDCTLRDSSTAADCGTCMKDQEACANARGLSQLGENVLAELASRGMLIDVAHMSDRTIRDVDGALADNYPMFISHGDPRGSLVEGEHQGPHLEYPASDQVLDILNRRCGVFGQRTGMKRQHTSSPTVPNDCDGSVKSFAQAVSYLRQRDVNVAFGLDMNGMVPQAVPRFSDGGSRGDHAACLGNEAQQALQTGGVVDDPATADTNEADLNVKGLAHVGMVGAFVDELYNLGMEEDALDNIESSAENFIRMWECADDALDAPPPPPQDRVNVCAELTRSTDDPLTFNPITGFPEIYCGSYLACEWFCGCDESCILDCENAVCPFSSCLLSDICPAQYGRCLSRLVANCPLVP